MPNVSGGLSFTLALSFFLQSHSLCLQSHFPFPAPFSVLFWLQLSFDLASGADSNCAASIAVSLHPPLPLGFPLPAQSVAHKRNSFTDFLLKAFFELSWLGHLNLQCPAASPPPPSFPSSLSSSIAIFTNSFSASIFPLSLSLCFAVGAATFYLLLLLLLLLARQWQLIPGQRNGTFYFGPRHLAAISDGTSSPTWPVVPRLKLSLTAFNYSAPT